MKVLFVNPPNIPFTEKSLLIEPIDILSAASYIQSYHHKVKVIDMDVKAMYPEEIYEHFQDFRSEVVVIIHDYHIPLHTSEAIEGIKKIASLVKRAGSKVIVSGKTAKHYPEIFLENGIDVVIRGEIELTLRELLDRKDWTYEDLKKVKGISFKNNNEMVTTKDRIETLDLDTLPMVDRRLIDLEDYIGVRTILSSRGCIGRCGFCATPDYWGKWRCQSAKRVVDEIQYLSENYEADKILFLDDNATVNRERMKEISKEIKERGLKVRLGCLGSISTYDKQMLEMMFDAGFRWIHYGVESGCQRLLNEQKKGMNIDYAKRVIKETKEIGMRVRSSFILDLPGTDEDAIKDTIDFILDTQPDEIRLHYLSLRVGTRLFEELKYKDNIPSQYIHSDKSNFLNNNMKLSLNKAIKYLLRKLEKLNYKIINNASQWSKINETSGTTESIKFVSFCPSKYGLGWGK